MSPVYSFMFGAIFVISAITIVVTSIHAYFAFGPVVMLAVMGTYATIAIVGGIVIYKRRKVSVFGRWIRDD